MRFGARLCKLETANGPALSPHVRRWLGHSVTDRELAEYDERRVLAPDFDDGPGYSRTSPEFRKWLGV